MDNKTEMPTDGPILEFERPVVELEKKIDELRVLAEGSADLQREIVALGEKVDALQRKIFSDLSPWQKVLLSRHPGRPYTLDYISRFIRGFYELHGDRAFGDDPAIVAGFGWLELDPPNCDSSSAGREISVLVVGHQKGRSTKENVLRNFGMPKPEGYRKALRLMQTAARLGRPILTFIDTPGAYPGIDAEERGQAEAIAKNLEVMSSLPVPIICCVIGEGGSGGALALGVADRILMLENTIYSVISPEGCASILWRDNERRDEAARALKITAGDLQRLGVNDEVIAESRGGAHRDWDGTAEAMRKSIAGHLETLLTLSPEELVRQRYNKFRRMGAFVEIT